MESEGTEGPSIPKIQSVAVGPAVWVPSNDTSAAAVAEASGSKSIVAEKPASNVADETPSHPTQSCLNQDTGDANSIINDEAESAAQRLRKGILSEDDDNVSQILQQNPELVASSGDGGMLPLHLAVDQERTFVVALLLHHGANTEAADDTGRTALHLVAKNGNYEIARLVVDAGANLEAISLDGEKPLWIATHANRENIAQLFLDKEADPESLNTITGTTALTEAVKSKNIRLVQLLLTHGADADADASLGIAKGLLAIPTDPEKNDRDTMGPHEIIAAYPSIPHGTRLRQASQWLDEPTTMDKESKEHKKGKRPHHTADEPQIVEPPVLHSGLTGSLHRMSSSKPSHSLPDRIETETELMTDSHPAVAEANVPDPIFPQAGRGEKEEQNSSYQLKKPPEKTWKGHSGVETLKDSRAQFPSKSSAHKTAAPTSGHEGGNLGGDQGKSLLYFHDAVGRKYHFPFHLVRTWKEMERLINLAFAHIDPESLRESVLQGRYDLRGPQQEIILPSLWDLTIRPGWHVHQLIWPDGASSTRRERQQRPTARNARVPPLATDSNHTQRSQRPLHEALQHGDPEIAQLLLQHGANVRLRGLDGRSAQQIAEETNKELADMIRSGVPLVGPSMSPRTSKNLGDIPTLSRPRAPPRGSMKWEACRSFEATAIQFHLDGKEERYQKSMSIYELLYEKGPQAAFQSQNLTKAPPRFTWYHLPANNMEWVEHLMLNVFMDQHSQNEGDSVFASMQLGEPVPRNGVHNRLKALRRKAQKITKSWRLTRHSFVKPLCMEVHDEEIKVPDRTQSFNIMGENTVSVQRAPSIVAFIPFLHFETSQGQRMATNCVKRLQGLRIEVGRHHSLGTHPIEQLIGGYMIQTSKTSEKILGLQPRRSLDDYFFTHLQSSGTKDANQVLWRFSKARNPEQDPKIFMVDQLWMWILDEKTIITCSPLNWDAWASEVSNEGHTSHIWQGEDPINIQKRVIDHLKRRNGRACVTSVYEMGQLVADKCASMFDGHDLDDDLHFFDFFEQTISRVSDEATYRLESFRRNLLIARSAPRSPRTETFDIQPEMNLLIEVQDISEELDILKMVLVEQQDTLNNMRKILYTRGSTQWDENHVLMSHHTWVERMKETNGKTRDALYRLLELKQAQYAAKQAQLMAEQSRVAVHNSNITNEQLNLMRAQTEETAKQLTAANSQLEVSTQLLGMMQLQSEESDKQSKTLLVFTVVTIVFLPSSFLAAVFAINMDAFPLNGDGQMPLGYFMKYLFSISIAVCFPLLIVAFNLPRISKWLSKARNTLAMEWENDGQRLLLNIMVPLAVIILALATLVPVWTSTLSMMIKAAVTACVVLFLFVGVIIHLIGVMSQAVRLRRKGSSSATSDSSSQVIGSP